MRNKQTIKKGLLWLACLFILASSLEAQSELDQKTTILKSEAPALRFENIGISEGMKQQSATDIIQDRNGFIWIGTQQGLHRYDGHEFKVYQPTAFDTTSLSVTFILGMAEAKNGDIWVSTDNGGLNRLDQATGTFKKYRSNPNDSTSISSNTTIKPFEDSKGNLWVGTFDSGLNRMRAGQDGLFDRFANVEDDSTSLSNNRVFFVDEDAEGFIWVGTLNGLNRIHPETDEITRFLYEPGQRKAINAVTGVYFPPNETNFYWLVTGAGLVKFYVESGNYDLYEITATEGGAFNRLNVLTKIVPDPENPTVLWVSGPGTGLARFDMNSNEFTSYRSDPKDPTSLSNDIVESLFLDKSGTIWAGTSVGGINTFNPGAVNFTHLKNDPTNEQSIAPGLIWGIYEDNNGSLWISSNSGFTGDYLTEYDINTGKSTRYERNVGDSTSVVFGIIRAFAEDQEGNLWIGSGGALTKLNRTTKKAKRYRHPQTPEEFRRNDITKIIPSLEDPSIFLVASFGGLDEFDTKTGKFKHISLALEDSSSNSSPLVFEIHQSSDRSLWLGTNQGLLHISAAGKTSIASTYSPTDTLSINNNLIFSITQRVGEPNVLWLGMDNGGLNRFDITTKTATHYTEEDGLPNNTVYSVLVDDKNTLWMSTNNGISNFDPETETFRNYGLDDGLMALEYDQHAYFKSKNGVFYFGSGKGVTAFVPENLQTNETPPSIAFTDFKIFNKSLQVGPDSPLKKSLNETDKITLRYDQNEITFDYVALHYANSKSNTYAYQLKGFDSDWIDAGTKRTATYTNLPFGEYTFHVKAANADGIWNNAGITMGLHILPPWYRTWWAYGIFILMFGFTVFGVDRFQRARIAVKEAERAALNEATYRAEAENKRRADTEQLSKIGRAITSSLSVNKIIETVYGHVNELMNASVFGVGIYNKEEARLDFPATKEKGVMLEPYVNELDEENRLAVYCFKNAKEIIIGDYPNEYTKYISVYKPPIVGEAPLSVVYLPLVIKGRVIGVITTQSFNKNAYTPYHINLLRSLATYVAIALDNASAYRKLNATLSELQATQQQLVLQEKLASLGQLTAGIAHEIKNPLNFVNNFSELSIELIDEVKVELSAFKKELTQHGNSEHLEDAEAILDDISRNLKKIHEHGTRADSIVKSMLQHSRGSDSTLEPTAINPIIKEYVNLSFHGMRAGKNPINVDLVYDLDESIGEIPLIAEDFSRVLVNLSNNAFDAMREKEKGEKGNGKYSPKLTVRTRKVGASIHIQVEDNGPGIPEEMKDKILQPFFTTKKGAEGTGLGLSITNDIIKAHGGELFVESNQDEGSIFTIVLYHKEKL